MAAWVGEPKKVVVALTGLGGGAAHGRGGVDQIGGRIGGAAGLARVAVLVFGVALWAFAANESVGKEHLLDRVVELLDGAHLDEAGILQGPIDALGEGPVLG